MNPMKWWRNKKEAKEAKRIQSLFILRNDLDQYNEIPVEIISGKYTGLVYQYGRVEFPNDNIVGFEYFPLFNEYLIEDKEDFQGFAGRILMYMLEKREYFDIIRDEIGEE